jgi:hypothetical protein
VGDEDDVARIVDEMLFQPLHAFGVEMVGRLVQQQDFRLFEEQAAQRDAAAFTAGKIVHAPVAGRATQRLHRDFELVVERPAVDRVDLLLQVAHFGEERIEIGILGRIAHDRRDFVEAIDEVGDLAHPVHDVFLDCLFRVELRLLREIADADALGRPRLALILGVIARHDLHQRGLARAVDADDRDLGSGEELQVDVVEHRLGGTGEGLGQTLHDVAVLDGHRTDCSMTGVEYGILASP